MFGDSARNEWMHAFRRFLAAFVFLVAGVCFAGESAVVIVYQPIITESEDTPMGVKILPVPFLWWNAHSGSPAFPYSAITAHHQLLTDASREEIMEDRNLLSAAGIRIAGSFEDGTVYVRFENYSRPLLVPDETTLDDVAEAALECIRRVAHDLKKRPKLIISGKGDEAKWKKWEGRFAKWDLEKPFQRPAR
jgi:hypothetical protein